jgi:DNA-binding transcriptional LysR family regulator
MTKTDIDKPFHLAASYNIGSYILPGQTIDEVNNTIERKVKVHICACTEVIKGLKEDRFDLGLIELPLFDDELLYEDWLDDELVICSNIELPKNITKESLSKYNLICRKEKSITRRLIGDFFEKFDISYESFQSLSQIDNITAAIQAVKWTKPNLNNPTITIVSKFAIEDKLKYKELFVSRIEAGAMMNKHYIVYSKKRQEDSDIHTIITQLMKSMH